MDWLAAIPIIVAIVAAFLLGRGNGKLKSSEKRVESLEQDVRDSKLEVEKAENEARNAETVAASQEAKAALAAKVVQVIAGKMPDTLQAEDNLQRLEEACKEDVPEKDELERALEIAREQAERAVIYIGDSK